MSYSLFRVFAVAVVVLSLSVISVPAVQAAPLGGKAPSIELRADWFEAAMSWVRGLLPTADPQPARRVVSTVDKEITLSLNTGSCIDPQGRPRPCPEY